MSDYRIDTKCIQEGYHPGNGEPRVVPIVQSTTYTYDSSEAMGDLFDLKAEGFCKRCRFRPAGVEPVEVLPGVTLDIKTWEKLWR